MNLLYASLAGLALFIPFSIAGSNTAIGFGILGWLIAIIASSGEREFLKRLKEDPIFLSSLLLVGTGLVSALMSDNISRALKDWKSYWLFIIYILMGYHLRSPRFRKALFWILFAASSLSGIVALIQSAGGLDFLFLHIREKTRASSTLFIMTFAGIFYQMIVLNFAMLLRESRSTRTFWILFSGIIIQTAAFLFALSRGAWIALFFGVLASAFILKRRKVILIGAVFFTLIAVLIIVNPTLNSRLRSAVENIKSPQDRSIKSRYVLWDISLDLIKEYPVFGAGMGDFSGETESRLRGRFVKSTSDAHNIYLHVLATRGIFGFIPFVLFWIYLLKTLFRLEKSCRLGDSFNRHLVVGVISATFAVLIGAITENNIDDSEVFIAFLFILGLARSTEWDLKDLLKNR